MHSLFIRQDQNGFTMFEVIVSMGVFVILIMITGSIFSFSQTSFISGANKNELSQNVRVALDRMSREIRQAESIVTDLPPVDDDPFDPPASELFLQDGHDSSTITYIRYYLDGSNLMRAHEAYYFPSDPGAYVLWDSLDQFGNTTTKIIVDADDNIIGEYFESLLFWGSDKLVNIRLALRKGLKTADVTTSVFSRNN